MPSFESVMAEHFQGALTAPEFIGRSMRSLWNYGFTGENSIALAGVCRDEITKPFVDRIHAAWGEAFNFASLAGMWFAGRTAMQAAFHHAPHSDDRQRYVVYTLAHIGVDENGTIGICRRAGQKDVSSACGSLVACLGAIREGRARLEGDLDREDIEQCLVERRLTPLVKDPQGLDLVILTRLAQQAAFRDVERTMSHAVDPAQADHAVISGIQIHHPFAADYVWPGTCYVVKDGVKSDLVLAK